MNYIFDSQFKDNDAEENRYPVPVSTIEQPMAAAAEQPGYLESSSQFGKLLPTRQAFEDGIYDKDDVSKSYLSWLAVPALVLLKIGNIGLVGFCAKRGNRIWSEHINEKFSELETHNPVQFFNPRERGTKRSKLLYVTLTLSHDSIAESWLEINEEFNRFLAALAREFNSPVYPVRVIESHEDGFPHIHCLLYFPEHEFNVQYEQTKITKDGEFFSIFRILAAGKVKKHWYGNSDIQACYNTDVLYYLAKHNAKYGKELTKESDKKHLLTLAMTWVFHKRTFSISKKFVEFIRLDSHRSVIQTDLTKFQDKAELIGIVKLELWEKYPISELFRSRFNISDPPEWVKPLIARAEAWKEQRDVERSGSYAEQLKVMRAYEEQSFRNRNKRTKKCKEACLYGF